jgi:RNA polymerase sigma-70 factor, ECF subfamily
MTETRFEELFKEHFTPLCNIAYTMVKDRDQARDITQQVFVRFWEKRDEIEVQTNLRAYLHRAVVNTAINHIEKLKRLKFEEDYTTLQKESHFQPDTSDFTEGEVEEAVQKAIANLPEKCQVVFSLSRFQGMSNQEISDNLDISIKAVEKHIGRALKELRVTLRPYMHLIGNFLIIGVGLNVLRLFL